MSEVVIKTTFQFKRGKAAAWSIVNPVLAAGEPGFELDTGKLKIGDGERAWNELPYHGGSGSLAIDGSLVITDDGSLSLSGFESAEVGQIPFKDNDGTLSWSSAMSEEEILNILNGKGEDA